jgi:DNA invertase Pin-like site-specific DNA recombinase
MATMKLVACYIRVSTVDNDQSKQRRDINRWLKQNRFGSAAIRWYMDKPSGSDLRLPKLQELQADLAAGKIKAVVVWHLDRLAFAARDGLNLLADWCAQSLRIVSVSQSIDIKSDDGMMVSGVLRRVAEMDSQARRERTRFGLAAARARGRMGGRPPVSAEHAKVKKAKELQQDTTLSVDEVCRRLDISRSTYYRYLQM